MLSPFKVVQIIQLKDFYEASESGETRNSFLKSVPNVWGHKGADGIWFFSIIDLNAKPSNRKIPTKLKAAWVRRIPETKERPYPYYILTDWERRVSPASTASFSM